MIRFGLRMAVAGGQEALVRLLVTASAVGLGVALLLITTAAINGTNSQNARYAWFNSGVASPADHPDNTSTAKDTKEAKDPLWWLVEADHFDGRTIGRVTVAATGPDAPLPPGMSRLPGPGEYVASPALARLLDATPPSELGDRFPGHLVDTIGPAALPAPDSLVVVIGRTPAQAQQLPGVRQITAIQTVSPNRCGTCPIGINDNGISLILAVATGALIFPVLILIGTATRLSAARREQRFAAMRLVGATPRQVAVVSAVESTVAAAAGAVLGFLLFLLVRAPLADIPFTGTRFFPADFALRLPDVLLVGLGVPVAAAVAARLALRRVNISPLGVSLRVTPRPPRAYRLIPLALGLGELVFFLVRHPPTVTAQIWSYLSAFLLIMAGLVVAGPWLTMAGARAMARRTRRPAGLIAARRLADNPAAGFRAISGLILALFVTSATVGIITTMVDERGRPHGGTRYANVLRADYTDGYDEQNRPADTADPIGDDAVARLRAIPGVRGVLVGHTDPAAAPAMYDGDLHVPNYVECGQLADVAYFGTCEPGVRVAAVPTVFGGWRDVSAAVWPAAPVGPEQVAQLRVTHVVVNTDGSSAALEQARTQLAVDFPGRRAAMTLGEVAVESSAQLAGYQRLADVVIVAGFPIAGCSLAVSVAGGLSERRRPFGLLRLTGVPLRMLRRVVALESAVPLLAVAVVAVATGLLAADLFLRSQLDYTLHPPGVVFYLFVLVGLAAALGIIAATLPLLNRITGPETVRNE
ncbi:ABC transporter permease [Kitasatospora paracochleata]|uniref:ABC3 transporter permease C-terminal domain-containing protein n=1 Tax=Kitasatospora paracochleata TaxID=58354 RepID=A0ABT1J5F8_9ACTN|nr:FtsX-like permease family protein [Kitasatospora paracochleata]MCP2312271.1 hypothetical protein [Kitasatospora paracochleata]